MRHILISRIADLLSSSNYMAEWLPEHDVTARDDAWKGVLKSLDRITDEMLIRIYTKLILKDSLVICYADKDGQYLNIKINGIYGGMLSDGSCHT